MRRLVLTLVTVLFLLASVTAAPAYDKAGHYYSAAVIVRKLVPGLDPANARLIAFCSQLPDEASELDAVEVYRSAFSTHPIDWMWWGYSSTAESDLARRMVTVQQLLHGLTGGDTQAVEWVAKRLVGSLVKEVDGAHPPDVDTLCALGLALHFYGDAYAHRSLRPKPWWCHSKGENCMYPTGRGHADDLHLPDYPLFEGLGLSGWLRDLVIEHLPASWSAGLQMTTVRRNLWLSYLANGYANFPKRTWPSDVDQTIQSGIANIATTSTASNEYGEQSIRTFLWRTILAETPIVADSPYAFEVLDRHGHEPCQDVFTRFAQELNLDGDVPRCRRVWAIYATHARQAFCDDKPCEREDSEWAKQARDDYDGALQYPKIYADLYFPVSLADLEPPKPEATPGRFNVTVRHQHHVIIDRKDDSTAGVALGPIGFDTGSSKLDGAEIRELKANAPRIKDALSKHADWWLHVRGHADERGAAEDNRRLAMLRAAVVADWLVGDGGLGQFEGRMILSGFGEDAPFCRTEDHPPVERDACWEANRTVHLAIGPTEADAGPEVAEIACSPGQDSSFTPESSTDELSRIHSESTP